MTVRSTLEGNDEWPRFPRVEDVILTQIPRGSGTNGDPCRTVVQAHYKDGRFIAEEDPCHNYGVLAASVLDANNLLRRVLDVQHLPEGLRESILKRFDPPPLG